MKPSFILSNCRRPDYTLLCSNPMFIQAAIIDLITLRYNCLFSHPPPSLFSPLSTSYRLQRTTAVTFSCLCLNTVSDHRSCTHPICKQLLSAYYVGGIAPGIKVKGGRRTFSGLHRKRRVTRLESNIQRTDCGRPWQPWQRCGKFFFFFFSIRQWEHIEELKQRLNVTRSALLEEHSAKHHTQESFYLQSKRAVNTWRREHSKIQLGPLPPTPSIWVLDTQWFLWYLFFIQLCLKLFFF